MAWQLTWVQTVTSFARELAEPIRFRALSHDSSKPNCIMRLTVAVTPISRSLNRSSVDDDLCLFMHLLLAFRRRTCSKLLLPRAGKDRSQLVEISEVHITWISLLEWGMRLLWRYIRVQFELTEVARPFLLHGLGPRLYVGCELWELPTVRRIPELASLVSRSQSVEHALNTGGKNGQPKGLL